jgi:hypothetical protein
MRIEVMFIRFVLQVVNTLQGSLANIIAWGAVTFVEGFEYAAIDMYGPFVRSMISEPDFPPELKTLFESALSGTSQAGAALLGGLATNAAGGASGAFLTPFFRLINYGIDKRVHSNRPDLTLAIAIAFRFPSLINEMSNVALELGYEPGLLPVLQDVYRPHLNTPELFALSRRFPEFRGNIDGLISAFGWSSEERELVDHLTKTYPGIQDIIQGADRFVYDERLAEKFQYDAELDPKAEEEATKIGLDPEFFKFLWRGHWQQLGLDTVIQMWRRLRPEKPGAHFTEDDLTDYLAVQPISHFWHDKIRAIQYDLVTRVDARRMFETGIWLPERLLSHYIDLGYSPQDAADMVAWQQRDKQPANKDLSRSAIESAYVDRIFTRQEATDALKAIGYDDHEIGFYLDLDDFNIQQAKLKEDLTRIKTLYVAGEYSTSDVLAELGPYNLPSEQTTHLFETWDIARRANISLPTQGELEDWYLNHIITIDQYGLELDKRNYAPERKEWTLLRVDQKLQVSAKLAIDNAAKEAARLASIAGTTKYQTDRQNLEISNAELNLQIADIKVALHDITDTTMIDAGKLQILQLQQGIKANDLAKAQLLGTFIQTKG